LVKIGFALIINKIQVCPILIEKIDYDRLLEEEKFHIDLHLKVRGVTLFKNDDEGEIVSGKFFYEHSSKF
jgi:hypothetical protein